MSDLPQKYSPDKMRSESDPDEVYNGLVALSDGLEGCVKG